MSPARPHPAPERVTVRMYQVGFGDSFLLSLSYAKPLADGRSERHVMIDFGSTRWPGRQRPAYAAIADDVAARTAGKLDALVITHRHKDHIGGFGADAAAERIKALEPSLVVRPWTEDPDAPEDPTARGPGERSRGFAQSLEDAQVFAGAIGEALPDDARGFRAELAELAFGQLANQEAIARIDALAANARKGASYVHAGISSGLEKVLPGVGVQVLGPPTLEQWPAVAGERANDPEYWLRQHALLERGLAAASLATRGARAARRGAGPPAGGTALELEPGPVRSLVERIRDQHTDSLLRIVRTLDDAMNNTSVILLVKAGNRRLLFPGDAQIENWSYALTAPKARRLREALADVDLYKVGHHGSRNATPRSLVAKWEGRKTPLTSLMSTLPGVHGKSEGTAVPRATLIAALKQLGPLYRTDELADDQLSVAVEADTGDPAPGWERQ